MTTMVLLVLALLYGVGNILYIEKGGERFAGYGLLP